VKEFCIVGKARLGGAIQKRGSLRFPIVPGFLTALVISLVVAVVAVVADVARRP
jgi:hypothetical protein